MVDLQTLANYAEIFGAVTVLGGFAFAVIQLRALRLQRRDAAAVQSIMSFVTGPEFSEHVRTISVHSAEEILERVDSDKKLRAAIDAVNAMAEGLGMLVYQKSLSLEMVAEWGGGGTVAMWNRVKPLAMKERAESGRTGPYDWFEWLAVQLERHCSDMLNSNAVDRHGDWKPPRW